MRHLGSLEEEILLIVMGMKDAYGVSVAEEYLRQTKDSISIPAVHTVMRRLENKGLLCSRMGDSTAERGGRRKRLYEATTFGFRIIRDIQKERIKMWSHIPELKWNKS